MAKTVADVMNMVKEAEVKFVDFRFTDTRGKEQHVTVPISAFGEEKFTGGHAFDGSSIAGWKGIEASDMQLMPDANTANIDPFFEEPTYSKESRTKTSNSSTSASPISAVKSSTFKCRKIISTPPNSPKAMPSTARRSPAGRALRPPTCC